MKRLSFAWIFIFAVLVAGGCGAAKQERPADQTQTVDQTRSLEKMPSIKELREFYNSHSEKEYHDRLREIKPLIDQASEEEFRGIFEESLKNWAVAKAPTTIDHVSVEVSRDDLMMNEYANQKMYENLFVRVNVYYDPKQLAGDEAEVVEEIYDGVMDAVRETPYGAFKIYEMTIACYDSVSGFGRYGESTQGFGNGYSELGEKIWVAEQPADEYHVQTIVYDFVHDYNDTVFDDEIYMFARHENVTLSSFGIKPDSGELYMKIPIYMSPVGQDAEEFADSLAGKGQEIYNRIMTDEEAVEYLKDQKVQTIVIEFYTPWSRERNQVHAFHLEGQ